MRQESEARDLEPGIHPAHGAPVAVGEGCTDGALPPPYPTGSEAPVSAELVASPDGRRLTTSVSGALPYQRFELHHPGGPAKVSWLGSADPDRVVALYAWDADRACWDGIARGRGGVRLDLSAVVGWEHDDDGVLRVLALGVDPFDVPVPAPAAPGFRDPATYDLALVHLTDTQYLSQGAVAAPTAAERQRFARAYRAMVDWIVANAERRKIAYVAHTGDLVESWLWPDADPQAATAELAFASATQAVLDDAGIPNGVLPGNHDNKYGSGDVTLFNEFFGPDRYAQAARRWRHASYGGPWRPEDNANHYDLLTAGGLDLVVVHLGYGVTPAAAEWAGAVLREHAGRQAVVLTHAYLEASWRPDGAAEAYSDEGGAELVRDLVERHENVVLVLSGHNHGVAWSLNRHGRRDAGLGQRRPVVELLADYQSYEVDGVRACGFLRLLQVDVQRGEVAVTTYSPSLGAVGAVPYDPAARGYDEAVDAFTLPLALPTRTTALTTRCVRVG